MSRGAHLLGWAWLGMLSACGPAGAAGHALVPGFERFFTVPKADLAKGGRLLLGELNCVSCHPTTAEVKKKQAPVLDNMGTRVRVGYLRKFLREPQAVKPGSTMPAVFAEDPDRDQKVEALVHFLAATGQIAKGRA